MEVRTTTVGEKRESPNIYLSGSYLERGDFGAGQRFEVDVDGHRLTLTVKDGGARKVSHKKKNSREIPVIDINNSDILDPLKDFEAVRVVIQRGRITLLPLASELKAMERFHRAKLAALKKEFLTTGSLSTGMGMASQVLHETFKDGGYEVKAKFANEIRADALDHALEFNPALKLGNEVMKDDSMIPVILPMQEMAQDEWLMKQLGPVFILEAGLPCSGASKAGRTKNKISMPEQHEHVGHLVHACLNIVQQTQPVVLFIENVPEYRNTASMEILKKQLRDMGYNLDFMVMNSNDFGALEARDRVYIVATTKGLEFSFDAAKAPHLAQRVLKHILQDQDLPQEEFESLYKQTPYLEERERLMVKEGKGHRRLYLKGDDSDINTLRKGYQKAGLDDARVIHPDEPWPVALATERDPNVDLGPRTRLLTAFEHALAKGFSEAEAKEMLGDISNTIGHEFLGQGITRGPVAAVAVCILNALKTLHDEIVDNPDISLKEFLREKNARIEEMERSGVVPVTLVMAKESESLIGYTPDPEDTAQQDLFAQLEESFSEEAKAAPKVRSKPVYDGSHGVG